MFDPSGLNVFTLPKNAVSTGLSCVIAGILGALVMRHSSVMLRWTRAHIVGLAFALTYTLAALLALDHRVALFGTSDRSLGLLTVLDGVFLFFALLALVRTPRDVRLLGATLGASVLVVVLYEVVQAVGVDPIRWGNATPDNLFATFGNRGAMAQALGTLAVAFAGAAIGAFPAQGRIARIALIIAAVSLAGALLSGSRAALFGMAAGAVFVLAVRLLRAPPRLRVYGATAAVAAALALGVVASFTPTGQRVGAFLRDPGSIGTSGFATSDPSVAARVDLYRVAIQMWRERPLLGVGPDNYAVAFPAYRTEVSNQVHDFAVSQTSTHSWLLKILTDAGLLGLLSFLALVGLALAGAVRGRGSYWRLAAGGGITAFLVTGAVSIDHVATSWLPWLGFGLVFAPVQDASLAVARSRRGTRWTVSEGARVAAVAAGVLAAVLVSGSPLEANRHAAVARAALTADRDISTAVGAGRRATSLDPGRAEYWHLLGTAELRAGRSPQAIDALERAVEIAPFQVGYWADLARAYVVESGRGNADALGRAADAARRAAEVDPNNAISHFTKALILLYQDDPAGSVAAFEHGMKLGRAPEGWMYEVAGRAYLQLGRPADAARAAESGMSRGNLTGLRLVLFEALAVQGERTRAARGLLELLAATPEDPRARALQAKIVEPDADRLVIAETFERAPAWVVDGGGGVGRVRNGVLTAASSPWSTALETGAATNVRVSAQFRATARPQPHRPDPAFEIGRRIDASNSFSVAQTVLAGETRLLLLQAGEPARVGGESYMTIKRDDWYWLEVAFVGRSVTVMVYHSGSEPVAKGRATLKGIFEAELPASLERAPLFIASSFDPPVQIGGVTRRPGGLYVERLD